MNLDDISVFEAQIICEKLSDNPDLKAIQFFDYLDDMNIGLIYSKNFSHIYIEDENIKSLITMYQDYYDINKNDFSIPHKKIIRFITRYITYKFGINSFSISYF